MKIYLEEQLKLHPSMQMQDVIKLCYQAAYGAEHMLRDVEMARKYFEGEWERTEAADIPLFENISDTYCRANIGAWKCQGKSRDQLFGLFVRTAERKAHDEAAVRELLAEAAVILAESQTEFTVEEFQRYCQEYMAAGAPAMHHSDRYRECEKPAYRLVRRDLLREI